MVSRATPSYPTMLREAVPQARLRTLHERVRSDADDTPADAGVGSTLAILEEEVHAARGPGHSPVAIAQPPDAADTATQSIEYQVEPLQIFKTLPCHG